MGKTKRYNFNMASEMEFSNGRYKMSRKDRKQMRQLKESGWHIEDFIELEKQEKANVR